MGDTLSRCCVSYFTLLPQRPEYMNMGDTLSRCCVSYFTLLPQRPEYMNMGDTLSTSTADLHTEFVVMTTKKLI